MSLARRLCAVRLLGLTAALVAGGACGTSPTGGTARFSSLPLGAIADSGFRPAQNGFAFQNYGDVLSNGAPPVNMTAADVEKLFGGAVCADARARRCDLIPEAQAWLDSTNAAMAGGHCYGFSVLAELLWLHQVRPSAFGAGAVTSLQIADNATLQRQIAYDWALQTLASVQSKRVTGTPNEILSRLIDALKRNPSQTYTLAFWKPDLTGGHAVTPYAVENKGQGHFEVLIYDNNWPDQTRAISFDTNRNTWSYGASANPDEPDSLYEGDAKTKTIVLYPTSPGLGTQPCPFCRKVPARSAAAGKGNTEEIYLTASDTNHANLVITDDAGRAVGYVHGTFVDQIPGAHPGNLVSNSDWANKVEPDFFLPADRSYTITVDGSGLTARDVETLGVVGPSFDLSVDAIAVDPGDRDVLAVEPDATLVSYTSSRPETPTIAVGVSDQKADYSFRVAGVSDRPGTTINIAVPAEGGTLNLQTVGSGVASRVSFEMTRETEQGVQSFSHGAIPLAVGDAAEFQFGSWTSTSQGVPVITTHAGAQSAQILTNQPRP